MAYIWLVQRRLVFKLLSIAMAMCALVNPISAQVDTTLMLKEVEVTATRIEFTGAGKHTDSISSGRIHQLPFSTLSTLLAHQTPLYVRSYGLGTLATLGIRGGSASHTQLMWNGIPIRNPMIGLVDLALIPTPLIDQVSVHYGGHGAAFGSGAVGGLISFSNESLSTEEKVALSAFAGDWASFGTSIRMNYGTGKFVFGTRIFHQSAKNDFRYKLNEVLPERRQTNHAATNNGLLQEIQWNANEQNTILARWWWQDTDREIPPTSVQTTSKSAQQDRTLRSAIQWKHNGDVWDWQVKVAHLDETINFQDSLIGLYTQNHFSTWIGELEIADRLFQAVDFTAGIFAEQVEATSANYEGTNTRNQQAAYASWRWARQSWMWRLQFREEFTDAKFSPLLVDLSAEWSLLPALTWKASISRNYRVPTLNDLYWWPGGNPALLPEEGWTLESGIHVSAGRPRLSVQSSATVYYRRLNQWIMWMPPVKDIRSYWSPINVNQVNSRGIEFRGDLNYAIRKWRARLQAGIDLTWSTFENALPEFRIEAGDQLFYVPVENVMTGLQLAFGRWRAHYTHHWFGASPGINEDVGAGNVGSASVSYDTHDSDKVPVVIYVQVENIWDVPYRLIERRPMPGRSVQVGAGISF
jgi:iron complex outermembrane receptor protein